MVLVATEDALERFAHARGNVFDIRAGDEIAVDLWPKLRNLAAEQRAALETRSGLEKDVQLDENRMQRVQMTILRAEGKAVMDNRGLEDGVDAQCVQSILESLDEDSVEGEIVIDAAFRPQASAYRLLLGGRCRADNQNLGIALALGQAGDLLSKPPSQEMRPDHFLSLYRPLQLGDSACTGISEVAL
ncbi:hypothetical protein [Rhizobium leguminosarum]|uniref:hypothetical protein n=1 Tax=Rhizobium leguminosarum TaxID=384 RepID=UPI0021BBD4B4|nr:hypothetical protein [Rhizobium leguminosarum]